jgi:hypothetical protein
MGHNAEITNLANKLLEFLYYDMNNFTFICMNNFSETSFQVRQLLALNDPLQNYYGIFFDNQQGLITFINMFIDRMRACVASVTVKIAYIYN